MKKAISRLTRLGTALAAGIVLNAVAVFAQTPPTTPPDGGGNTDANAGRRDRGNRGPGGGNQDANVQRGGRANFGGGLGLDEKQMELLREASQADAGEIRKLDERLRAAQKELVQAVVAEKYDENTVRQKADAVAKIQTEITMLRAKQVAAVVPTLKPEQREQWENSSVALGWLMRAGGNFGGGPGGNPGFARGDRGGFQPGPDGQRPPDGRNFRRGGGDPNGSDQPRRRGGPQ